MTLDKALGKIIDKYPENKAKWIQANGTDEGFEQWYIEQIKFIFREFNEDKP